MFLNVYKNTIMYYTKLNKNYTFSTNVVLLFSVKEHQFELSKHALVVIQVWMECYWTKKICI